MNRTMARTMARLALAMLVLPMPGCGLLSSAPKPVRPGWQAVTFAAAGDANANSALAVDVVLIKEKAVLESLSAMSASRYFAAKADLLRTYPEALTVLGVEITPGQKIRFDRKRIGDERIWAALVFANYASPGEHRLRLQLDHNAYLLQLNAQEFVATDSKTGAAR